MVVVTDAVKRRKGSGAAISGGLEVVLAVVTGAGLREEEGWEAV